MRAESTPSQCASTTEDPALPCVAHWLDSRTLRERSWKALASEPDNSAAHAAYEAADMAMWRAEDRVFLVQPTTADGALAVLKFVSEFMQRRARESFVPKPVGETIRRAVAVLEKQMSR